MRLAARVLRVCLEVFTVSLIIALAAVVVSAVVARYAFNASFVWYDEVASVLLAWITFYGAALAALKRRHLGFEGVLLALPPAQRRFAFFTAEAVQAAVFGLFAYAGWLLLDILGSETLVSLEIPLFITQSAVPVGAGLALLAQFLSLPDAYAAAMAGRSHEADEIAEEIRRAEQGVTREGVS